jgi:hypothetical protein
MLLLVARLMVRSTARRGATRRDATGARMIGQLLVVGPAWLGVVAESGCNVQQNKDGLIFISTTRVHIGQGPPTAHPQQQRDERGGATASGALAPLGTPDLGQVVVGLSSKREEMGSNSKSSSIQVAWKR